jgi:tRNA 2-thiouridine synthesizing protein C
MTNPPKPSKSVTFISRHPPYGRDNAFICLDLVLAYSVFDQKVNYLFTGDGVFQLLKNQQPQSIASKNISASLGALELYGVESVLVEEDALKDRGLALADLAIKAQAINSNQVTELINDSGLVFNL